MNRATTLKPGEIIPLTFDYVFTAIFNNPNNIDIIESFLSCYFEIPIEELKGKVTIIPRELELESKLVKNKQVDLLLDLKGEKINIELSNQPTIGIINRNIVYACNIHSRQLKYGDNHYANIEKTIQINLNNKHTNDTLKETYFFRNEKGKILSEKFQIDMVDMVIGVNTCYTNSETKLARWCKALTAKTEEEFKEAIGDGIMEENVKDKLVDEVNKYSNDFETIALYSAYSKEDLENNTLLIYTRREAEQKGIKQGKEQSKMEIAKNMLKKDMSINDIIEITGLTKEQLEELK